MINQYIIRPIYVLIEEIMNTSLTKKAPPPQDNNGKEAFSNRMNLFSSIYPSFGNAVKIRGLPVPFANLLETIQHVGIQQPMKIRRPVQ